MNLFELFVQISVDDRASDNVSKLSNKLGKGLATAAKIGTAAVSAAAAGVVALTKQSIESYAEFEQLVGGAQLMFGEAFETVMENARNAYSTVQMSQNEYLQQVNGFATGLKTALGGNEQQAAELAHRIVQAQADVVAATGNTQEAVQNAFNGIMKSNFTMLDNLQLGITPTKEGFQEVIDTVNEWNASMGNATNYQMGNLADMQNALVDYIDMVGMSGYAQEEAMKTISGSVSATRAAWRNLVTGLADDNADISALMRDFSDVFSKAANNILPRIEVALETSAELLDESIPILIEKIPQFVMQYAPRLVSSGVNLIKNLLRGIINSKGNLGKGAAEAIDFLLDTIVDLLPLLVEAGLTLMGQLILGILMAVPRLIQLGPEIFYAIVDAFISISEKLVKEGEKIPEWIKQGISRGWANLKKWFSNLWDSLFGNLNVNVNVTGAQTDENGSYANGLDYVPYDNYIARLHRGERVLTASEANRYNSEKRSTFGDINVYVQGGNYTDIHALAQAVAEAVAEEVGRKEAIYA